MNAQAELILIPAWMLAPFCAMLALIALGPFFFPSWWARHYPKVTAALALFVAGYYLLAIPAPLRIWNTACEYFSFIALIGSLFVVSGGIHINVKGEATPAANVFFLLIGAVAANFLGTTGASMLLIRPWLRMNKYRVTAHHVVFFIFIVSNVGGCLTPISDPPLFLGFLSGVPFWWPATHCLPAWAVGVGILLLIFYIIDSCNYRRAPKEVRTEQTSPQEQWRFDGLANLFFLAVVLGAVFISHPPFLREVLMLAAAAGSYYTTQKSVHEMNRFSMQPMREVAILFAGIFATMMPALDWLQVHASRLDYATPGLFYHGSGILSSILDSAPAYLCFLNAAFGRFVDSNLVDQIRHLALAPGASLPAITGAHAEEIRRTLEFLQSHNAVEIARHTLGADQIRMAFLLGNPRFTPFILAISVGTVFFGANTYIGNAPNLMVKAIADHQHIHSPTFLGYIFKYTAPFMLPMLLIVWWMFFV